MSRLFAWSDLHVDYPANRRLITELSDADYSNDAILIAGDLSSDTERLIACLGHLKRKFRTVSYVPGNHDVWVSNRDPLNSLEKLNGLLETCHAMGVHVEPFVTKIDGRHVCIAPLISWYLKPEDGEGSLFLEKPGEDPTLRIWSDNYRIRWPAFPDDIPAALHLLSLNRENSCRAFAGPTVTFSHFLPRKELVFSDWKRYLSGGGVAGKDENPQFNFTRVAGCRQLDELLRRRGSCVHIYGHQHRNRDRTIDGVRYVSHCLGYPPEWRERNTAPPRHWPLEISLTHF